MTKTLPIPATLSSAEDVREAIDGLRSLISRGIPAKADLSGPVRDLFDTGFLTDTDSLAKTVASFEDALKRAPRIGLTLAAPIDAAHKAELTAWFRENVSPSALIQFGHNRALLGGMLVRAGSRIFDFSYRSRLLDSPVSFSKVLSDVR